MITLKETAMFLSAAMMSFCSLHAATGDGYAKRFTITPGAPLGLTANSSLTDFPVLVRLSTAITDFDYADFENATLQTGETVPSNLDILFVDENGAVLPYEIQVWDPNGTSLVWVKVPALTVNTAITCYFGNANATNENTPTATWSAYAGAWHLDDVGVGGTSPDSSPNGYTAYCYAIADNNDRTTTGIPSTSADPLGAGGYRENVGKRSDDDVAESGLANGTGSGIVFEGTQYLHPTDATHFTVSAWFRRNHTKNGWDHLFYKKNDSRGDYTDGKDWGMEFHNEGGIIYVFGQWEADVNKSAVSLNHGITNADTWYYLSIVYDGYNRRIYRNGVLHSQGELRDKQTYFLPHWDREELKIALGMDSDQNDAPFQGSFDEPRLRFASYDADWARAEYQSMASAASLSYTDVIDASSVPNAPAIEDVTVTRDSTGVYSVSVTLAADSGSCAIDIIINESETIRIAETASAGETVTAALTLDPDKGYMVRACASDTYGQSSSMTFNQPFMTATVSVTGNGNAKEDGLVPSSVTFSRPASAATYEQTIAYTTDSFNGLAYATIPGTVTFPAGVATVDVVIQPVSNGIIDDDVDAVVTVAPGFYIPSETPATVTIVNCRDAAVISYAHYVHGVVEGYTADATLANFPLKIALSEDISGFYYRDFQQQGGGDLAVTDDFGNFLDFEIGTWNATGTSTVWVKVPALTAGTGLYVLYGSASPVASATTGISSLEGDGSDEWNAATTAMNAAPAAFTVFADAVQDFDQSRVSLTELTVGFDGDEVAVVAALRTGTGAVSVTLVDENGTSYTREIAANATAPVTIVKPLSELNLPAGLWYTVANAKAAGTDGSTDSKPGTARFYAGTLTAERVVDAFEYGLSKGRFRISIDGGYTTSSALVARYTTGGTATAGTEYEALSGTATIPAGASYVDVYVTPRDNRAEGDTQLDITLATGTDAGPVSVDDTSASIAIKDNSGDLGLGNYRKKLWLRASGYEWDDSVSNFPALIRLRTGKRGFSYADFDDQYNGTDIAFTDAEGNVIPHEIEYWNPNGESTVWVMVPTLQKNTRIRMYYGGPVREVDVGAMWRLRYKGVWHLNEPANAQRLANRTGRYMTAEVKGPTYEENGIVGPARLISDSWQNNEDKHALDLDSSYENQQVFYDNAGNNTFSLWFKYKKGQTPADDRLVGFQSWDGDGNGWTIRFRNGSTNDLVTCCGGEGVTSTNVFENISDGEWHHVVVAYAGTSRYIYADGELRARLTEVAAISGNWDWRNMCFGDWNDYWHQTMSFKGWMDEIRFAAGTYPAPVEIEDETVDGGYRYEAPTLVKAEYQNVKTGLFQIENRSLMVIVR